MLNFKKYNSIENSYDSGFMERVMDQMPSDLKYVVQEKVHGTNTSFICDGKEMLFAKRTALIEDGEDFYNYQELVDEYRNMVFSISRDIIAQYAGTVQVTVFGELFGGTYPLNCVKQNHRLKAIQKGVYYTPEHGFYAFDIYISDAEGNGKYLSVTEANAMFEKHGFFYARTLFEGNLQECLNYPNAFQSKISEWLGYPAIEDNICEGIVIRPVVPMYLRNGSKVMIKSKNDRFAEKKSVKKRVKLFEEPVPYSDELVALISDVEAYVTEQRLVNVISHIGEVRVPNDFGKIMGLFSKDALQDFLKEHGGDYAGLEKSEQKNLNKELNKLCTDLVKKYYIKS